MEVSTPTADGPRPSTSRRRLHRTSRTGSEGQVRLLDGDALVLPELAPPRPVAFAIAAPLVLVAVATLVFWIAAELDGPAVTGWVDDVSEGAAALVAAITCFVVAGRRVGRMRWAWRLIGLGALSWSFGQGGWTYLSDIHDTVPFPSPADVGFLGAIPFLLAGVLLYPSEGRTALSRIRLALDALIVAGSLLTVVWAVALNAFFMGRHTTDLREVISVAYPLADLVIATVVLSALTRSSRPRRVPLGCIAVAMLCLGVADSGFLYFTVTNSYPVDAVTDVGWAAGFLLLGLAALWPQEGASGFDDDASLTLWQAAIPYLLLAAAVGTDALEYGLHQRIGTFLVLDGLAVVGIVLVRQVIIVLENQRLTTRLEAAIATLQAEESELSRLALHDPLTGLANRLLFTERLDAALALASAGQRRVAVIFCDLDSFKDANDSLGHSAGDQMLVGVAERLLACVRPEDTVARLGGDEFAIVLEDLDDLSDASRVAARIVDAMRVPLIIGGEHFLLHVSIGIALASEGSYGIEELLRDADIALYAAKNAGGNRYRMFDSTMGTAYLDRLRLEADLASALERGELFLEYQPIIDFRRGRAIGVEALLRWRHPTRGLLQPASFLTTAERSGSIVAIGKWVLEESLRQLQVWHQDLLLPPDFSIAVNLSVRQLEAGDLVSSVERAILDSGVDPRAVRLELTETALIDRAEASIDLLHALRRLGVHLEIDDFGTGYSSLDYLRRLPLDILKIDQSFITGLGRDPHDTLIVETIINLAHALGMTVVAEGVETPLQLARLRSLGCDFGQGFYWSRSLAPEALGSWLGRATTLEVGATSSGT